MEDIKKIRPIGQKHFWYTLSATGLFFAVMVLVWIHFGEKNVDKAIAVLMFGRSVMDTFALIRTRNLAYLPGIFWPVIMALRLFSGITDPVIRVIYTVVMIPLIVVDLVFRYRKKLKWRYREVLELAARPVADTDNGFTSRPLSAGKFQGDYREIRDFADFCRRHLIALPIEENNRIIFLIESTFWHLCYLNNRYRNYTHILIDSQSNMLVSISKKSYSKYRDELSFDQLCHSLGSLFNHFFNLQKEGQGDQILDRMNQLKLKA